MRDVKFRGKRKLNGEWVYGSYIHVGDDWCQIIPVETSYDDINTEMCRVISSTVGQFTGLHDKNNNPIYEGDIFNMGDENIKYVVEWFDCGLRGRQLSNRSSVGITHWQDKIEIVGNIYESPLLNT